MQKLPEVPDRQKGWRMRKEKRNLPTGGNRFSLFQALTGELITSLWLYCYLEGSETTSLLFKKRSRMGFYTVSSYGAPNRHCIATLFHVLLMLFYSELINNEAVNRKTGKVILKIGYKKCKIISRDNYNISKNDAIVEKVKDFTFLEWVEPGSSSDVRKINLACSVFSWIKKRKVKNSNVFNSLFFKEYNFYFNLTAKISNNYFF